MRGAGATEDLDRFHGVVAERLGVALDARMRQSLNELFPKRLRHTGCSTAEAYFRRLDNGVGRQELETIAEHLSVAETYFYRHIEQLNAFAEVALIERCAARGPMGTVRILSAGCASGEEPYTLAMMATDAAPQLQGPKITITGIDVVGSVIRKAKAAKYTEWSLRETPAELRQRHFKRSGKEFVVHPEVRALVGFEQRNLFEEDEDFWQPESFDIIFCRNVMIYFTPEAIRSVVARFARALVPGGYLFLGASETLRGVSDEFHLCATSAPAFFYQRHQLEPASVPVSQRATSSGPRSILEPRPSEPDSVSQLLQAVPSDSTNDPDALLLQAIVVTNRAQIDEAEALCQKLLAHDEFNAGAHYLLALCCEHKGDLDRAREHHLTSVYLNPQFAMPHLHLGMIGRRTGKAVEARRELQTAHELLETEDQSRILLFGGGLSRKALSQMCSSALLSMKGAR